ncbi:MAG: carboxypeptidase regulatory-like domain-containing protein [Bacteroidia bacterium]
MNQRIKLILFLIVFFPLLSFSQTSLIKGIILNENNSPVENANVTLQGTDFSTITDSAGAFSISNVAFGNYTLVVNASDFVLFSKTVAVNQTEIDFGIVNITSEDYNMDKNIPTVSLTESDLREIPTQNTSSVLSASRDAFQSAASFGFSISRFRIRGYEDDNFITLMNGAPMTDLTTGKTPFYTWSGLNDVMRSRENSLGLEASQFSYGGVGGTYFIDSRASRQRKQFQISYSLANRSYDNRIMATYATGLLKSGWSFALSGSHRWSNEGYIAGTFYDSWSYFATAEKQINSNHSLAFTFFGAPGKNGKSSPVVQELYDLAGSSNYNPNWGWQNGEKRNAAVGRNNIKSFILTHEWKINNNSTLETALSYQFGKGKLSGLDWYNAPNPKPDYYRNLPSFTEDSTLSAQAALLLQNNDTLLQVNWDALYAANSLSDTTVEDADGIAGNSVSGKWARYIIEDRVTDQKIINFNTFYNNILSDHISFTAGLNLQKQKSEFYKEVNDLLGADFYVDINKYAEQDNPGNYNVIQNDLNNPNNILHAGDRFGYDYIADITKISGWWQAKFTFDKVDFFLASQVTHTGFFRDGKTKYGLFPDNSYGKSSTQNYTNYSFKGGTTYKLNGRNYLFANVSFATRAPYFENAYTSPRTRDEIATGVTDEQINSAEGGYLLKTPKMKMRFVGYYTNFKNSSEIRYFFNEATNSFGSINLTDIDKRHTGIEAAVERNLGKGFSASAVAAVGQYFYTSQPKATFNEDESAKKLIEDQVVYSKNLRVAGSPQSAYTAGIGYRSPNFWFLNLSFNYFDNIYIDFSPVRRTVDGIDLVDPDSELWDKILAQEKVKGQFTLDFFGGWSWKMNNKFRSLKRNTFLVLNVGVNNILDNNDFITNGFEQLRFDFENKDPDKYASKYFYAFGRTYFINLTLRFN